MKLLIRNGRVLNPANQFDARADVVIEAGVVCALARRRKVLRPIR